MYLLSIGLSELEAPVSFAKFYKIWKSSQTLGFMKIRKASKNVCDECTILRNLPKRQEKPQAEVSEIDKSDELIDIAGSQQDKKEQRLQIHQQEYRSCRTAYMNDIQNAKCAESDISTFSFDFQQVVEIPRVPQQPSQWYYWSPFKLYVFGIVDDAVDQHYHTMFTEAQQGKGANQVVSILHCFLTSIPRLTAKIHLWADNCGGQNKNKTMLWYLCWLVIIQNPKEIVLGFQIKGHTRNSVDRGLGNVKQKANRNEVWIPETYAELVDTTDKTDKIKAVRFYNDPPETLFRDWELACKPYLKALKGIQNYHFFRFASENPGIVEVKRLPQDKWIKVNLKKKDFLFSNFLSIEPKALPDIGLNPEQRHDLWNKYSPYVPSQYQNQWYYSKPEDQLISSVREKKNLRASNAKEARREMAQELNNGKNFNDKLPESQAAVAVKRGRGRPPGCKNKRKAVDSS